MKFRDVDGQLKAGWLWTIMIVGLLVIAICKAATPDRIMACKALSPPGYTGTALVGCPTANLFSGPITTTDLVRTIQGPNQVWVPFNTLTPASSVVRASTGKWDTLANVTITPAPTTPAPPVVDPPLVVAPPPPPPPVDVTVSLDGDKTYQPVLYAGVSATSCFTLTTNTGKTAKACLVP